MDYYYVTLTNQISGYEISLCVEADSAEEAEEQALKEGKEMLYKMIDTLRVAKVEE